MGVFFHLERIEVGSTPTVSIILSGSFGHQMEARSLDQKWERPRSAINPATKKIATEFILAERTSSSHPIRARNTSERVESFHDKLQKMQALRPVGFTFWAHPFSNHTSDKDRLICIASDSTSELLQ